MISTTSSDLEIFYESNSYDTFPLTEVRVVFSYTKETASASPSIANLFISRVQFTEQEQEKLNVPALLSL